MKTILWPFDVLSHLRSKWVGSTFSSSLIPSLSDASQTFQRARGVEWTGFLSVHFYVDWTTQAALRRWRLSMRADKIKLSPFLHWPRSETDEDSNRHEIEMGLKVHRRKGESSFMAYTIWLTSSLAIPRGLIFLPMQSPDRLDFPEGKHASKLATCQTRLPLQCAAVTKLSLFELIIRVIIVWDLPVVFVALHTMERWRWVIK